MKQVTVIIIPIFHRQRKGHREIKQLAQGHPTISDEATI